jgi:peptidyl-prolyl cis-trans isomerase B (cyclophilin B)
VRLLAVLSAVLLVAVAGCGRGGEPAGGDASRSTSHAPATTRAEPASGCERVAAPPPRPEGGERRPRRPLQRGRDYHVTVRTNCGDFTIRLDVAGAPRTAGSFVALARSGFYDGTVFHRIVPGFVIQGGDPTRTGAGGPGYQTVERPPSDARYTKGVVAMAKAENEEPGTAGSQFFVVTAERVDLPPDYAVLGRVTRGLEVVERIGRLGDAAERPMEVVVVQDMTVRAS